MRIPESLVSLIDHGVVEDVIRPLMSGKEAQVYLVVSGGEARVAKIYKEAQNRTFKNRAEYTEGRKTRNSRDQRAMAKRSRHGRAQDEAAWRSTEVDMIYRLRSAGVRVPEPHHFIDGVLIMELVQGPDGNPAPRLGEMTLPAADAKAVFDKLLREVVRMLCAGVVHGDLSDFNVLMAADGPVIIDFPQSVDASSNQNARKLLVRDVDNLYRFLERFVPPRGKQHYAQEMWQLYEGGELTPTTELTGAYAPSTKYVDTDAVVSIIEDATFDEHRRRESVARSGAGAAPGAGRRAKRGGRLPEESTGAPRVPQQQPSGQSHNATAQPPRDAAGGRDAASAPRAGQRPPRDTARAPRDGLQRPPRDGLQRPPRDAARPPRDARPSRDGRRPRATEARPERDGGRLGGAQPGRTQAPRADRPQRALESRPERDGNRAPRSDRDGNAAPWRDGNRAPQHPDRDGNRAPQRPDRDGNRAPQRPDRDGNRAPQRPDRDGNRAYPEERGQRPHNHRGDRPAGPGNPSGRRPRGR